jgi:phosphate transport system substrate-binding protein
MNNEFIVCKHCGYDTNPITATQCLKCGQTLDLPVKNINMDTKLKPKSLGDWLFTPWMIWLGCGLVFVLVSWSIYSLFGSFSSVNNSNGVGVVNSDGNNQNIAPDVKLYDSIKDVPNVPSGTFNYGGGNTFAALTAQGFHEAIIRTHPNFRLRFTKPRDGKSGGKKGVAMVLDSQLSFTLYGASLEEDHYNKALQRGFHIKQVPVALDMFVFFTHKDLSIPGLSIDQLQDIYKGKLTNWKQVGGPDLAITPFARDPKSTNLLNELLGKEVDQISSRVQLTRDYTEVIRKVAATPGGISFGGSGPILGQQTIHPLAIAEANTQQYVQPFVDNNKRVNATALRDGSYPMTRRMFIVYRQDGTIDQLAGEAYTNMLLTKEGQQIVEKAGLVPLR